MLQRREVKEYEKNLARQRRAEHVAAGSASKVPTDSTEDNGMDSSAIGAKI